MNNLMVNYTQDRQRNMTTKIMAYTQPRMIRAKLCTAVCRRPCSTVSQTHEIEESDPIFGDLE
jgi:hypothetical protein